MLGLKSIYSLPSLVTKNIRLQSLQYQIPQRYFACNYNLNIWNIADDPTCPYCSEIDTIEHYFYYCKESALVLKSLRQMSNCTLNQSCSFTVLEVMLGIPCEKKSVKCVINLLILLSKQFIFLQNTENTI